MTNPPRKLKTPCAVFTKRKFGVKIAACSVAEALQNCAAHKRDAEKRAKEIVKQTR